MSLVPEPELDTSRGDSGHRDIGLLQYSEGFLHNPYALEQRGNRGESSELESLKDRVAMEEYNTPAVVVRNPDALDGELLGLLEEVYGRPRLVQDEGGVYTALAYGEPRHDHRPLKDTEELVEPGKMEELVDRFLGGVEMEEPPFDRLVEESGVEAYMERYMTDKGAEIVVMGEETDREDVSLDERFERAGVFDGRQVYSDPAINKNKVEDLIGK